MKAEAARNKAQMAAQAAQQKALEKAQQADRLAQESHEIYLPNISSLSKELAQRIKGSVEAMIQNRDDVGMNVNGGYGTEKINSLDRYLSAINTHISSNPPPPEPIDRPDLVNLSSSEAAALYSQIQETHATYVRNGDPRSTGIDPYLSWLAAKAGIDTTA